MIRLITYDGTKSSAVKLGFEVSGMPTGYAEDYNSDDIIRWGNSRQMRSRLYAPDFKHVFNPAKSIYANCLKQNAIDLLSNVVRVPNLFVRKIPFGITAVLRPNEHMKGSGFEIVKGPYVIPGGHYAIEFIRTEMECRVWFCGKKTMAGKRARSADHSEFPMRAEWGYEFAHWFDPKLSTDTLRAAKELGLDCGAADVLYKDGECFFLELNSAPAVDHWRIENFFKLAIPEMVKERHQT